MVFYILVTGVQTRPSVTASSGVFERHRGFEATPGQSIGQLAVSLERPSGGVVIDVLHVAAVRLFRATGSRNLVEDALPIQRTSALLMVGVPNEAPLAELQAFLGSSMDEVEALRVLSCCGEEPGQGTHDGLRGSGGSFYSAVILCHTQSGADALYKANHGRLFHKQSKAAPGSGPSEGACAGGGPCCYLLFLEIVVYMYGGGAAAASGGEEDEASSCAEDVPSAAYELPACPLCLERLDVSGTGMVTHSQGWLSAMAHDEVASTGSCQACATIARSVTTSGASKQGETLPRVSADKTACQRCAKQEELWACLICGYLGCGRYASAHAKDHATQRKHRFCLELATGRIWDYSGDVFVHRRLVQMAAASGGHFDVTLPAPAHDQLLEGSPATHEFPKGWPGHEDILAMELDAILASQLDHQRSLFEAQLTELGEQQAKAADRLRSLAAEEEVRQAELHARTAEADRRRKALERQLAGAQKAKAEAEEHLHFVKDLNQSLLANRREIREAASGSSGASGSAGVEEADSDPLVKRLRERVAQLMEAVSAADDS